MPLDLSSATENTKDKSSVPEKLPEDTNDVSKINTGINFLNKLLTLCVIVFIYYMISDVIKLLLDNDHIHLPYLLTKLWI